MAGKPLLANVGPRARAGKPLRWNEDWSRYDRWDVALTVLAGATTLTTSIVKPIFPYRRGGILFDESIRSAVHTSSYDRRGGLSDISGVLLSLSITAPFLVDSLTVAYWYRGSPDVASQMFLIDLETFLVTTAVHGLFATFTARERPYGRYCGTQIPSSTDECDSYGRYRSFFSDHTSLSFASASLICSHHLTLELFDSRSADVASCITGFAAAATTGAMRVLSENHYTTDVLAGALIGGTMGFAVPYFLHYRTRKSVVVKDGVRIGAIPTPQGLSVVGMF